MELRAILSANAGVCLCLGGQKVWVDALHRHSVSGFSSVDEGLFDSWMASFAVRAPDAICYTHCHPDHFSKDLTLLATKEYPNARLFLPEKMFDWQELVAGECFEANLGALQLRFIKLPHEGEQYRDCLHYGILITAGDKRILIPGDCRLTDAALANAISGLDIDVALLDFPWLTLNKSKAFVATHIRPKNVILYHLPFEKDDVNGYLSSARRCGDGIKLLCEPMQEIIMEI